MISKLLLLRVQTGALSRGYKINKKHLSISYGPNVSFLTTLYLMFSPRRTKPHSNPCSATPQNYQLFPNLRILSTLATQHQLIKISSPQIGLLMK